MGPIRAVLFDYGHTLVDFRRAEEAMVRAYGDIRERLIREVEREVPEAADLARQVTGAIDVIVSRSYREQRMEELEIVEIMREAFAGIGIDVEPELAHELVVMDHRVFSESISVPEETLDVLDLLASRGLRLGLVSNITLLPALTHADLRRLGIAGFFGAIALSSEIGHRKPHRRIFRWTLDRLGVAPSEAVFVGDRLRDDISGASAAGMRTVLTRQFRDELEGPEREEAVALSGREALARIRPDRAIARLRELPALLDGLP